MQARLSSHGDEDEDSWTEAYGQPSSNDSDFRIQPFDHRLKHVEEFDVSVLEGFLIPQNVPPGMPQYYASYIKNDSHAFFGALQYKFPLVPATKVTHNVCKHVAVGVTPTTKQLVFTANFECSMHGCPVKWNQSFWLTPSGTVLFEEEWDAKKSGNAIQHVHLHAFGAAAQRNRKSPSTDENCDCSKLPQAYQNVLLCISNKPYVFQKRDTPIQLLANELCGSSLRDIESGNPLACNSSYNHKRGLAGVARHEAMPWIDPNTFSQPRKPSMRERCDWLSEMWITQDKQNCKTHLSPEQFQKMVSQTHPVWGQLPVIYRFTGGTMYLKVGRVHRKMAKRAARKSKCVKWDATGFKKNGVLISPMLMTHAATSGQSQLAPAPVIVGWIVVERDDKHFGVDSDTLMVGLRALFRILGIVPDDVSCDEDSAFMLAMRTLYTEIRVFRDPDHKIRAAEDAALLDFPGAKRLSLTGPQMKHRDRVKDLIKQYLLAASAQEAQNMQAHILGKLVEGSYAHAFFEQKTFDKDPAEYCASGRAHAPHEFDNQQDIEGLFSRLKNNYLPGARDLTVDQILYLLDKVDDFLQKRHLQDMRAIAAPLGVLHTLETHSEQEFNPSASYMLDKWGIDASTVKRPSSVLTSNWGPKRKKRRRNVGNTSFSKKMMLERSATVAGVLAAVRSNHCMLEW